MASCALLNCPCPPSGHGALAWCWVSASGRVRLGHNEEVVRRLWRVGALRLHARLNPIGPRRQPFDLHAPALPIPLSLTHLNRAPDARRDGRDEEAWRVRLVRCGRERDADRHGLAAPGDVLYV